jgi:hypothetical protein
MEIACQISDGSMDKYGKYGRHNQLPEITYDFDRAVFTRLYPKLFTDTFCKELHEKSTNCAGANTRSQTDRKT